MSIQAQQTALENMLKKQGQASLKQQDASLKQARDGEINDLNKGYNEAINAQKTEQRNTQTAFEDQKKAVQNQAYLDRHQTNVVAEDRGIQNSQQMIGLMQGDQMRTKSLLNENLTKRDRRLSEIRDRMNTIKLNKQLDIKNANRQYSLGRSGAQAGIDANVMEAIANLRADDLNSQRQLQNALKQMETQHGYDRTMQNDRQSFDQAMQNNQQAFQREMTQTEFKNAQKMAEQEFTRQQQAIEKEYDLALEAELSKWEKGTPEYEIRVRQLEAEKEAYLDEMRTKTFFEAQLETMGQVPHPGDRPVKKFFETRKTYESRVKQWQAKKKEYDEAQKALTP